MTHVNPEKPSTKPELSLVTSEITLTPVEQRCERAILYMLEQPDCTLKHPQAVEHFRADNHLLEVPTNEWLEVSSALFRTNKLLVISKSDAALAKPDTIVLQSDLLIDAPEMPFITSQILEAKERLMERKRFEQAGTDVRSPDFAEAVSVTALRRVIQAPAEPQLATEVSPAA